MQNLALPLQQELVRQSIALSPGGGSQDTTLKEMSLRKVAETDVHTQSMCCKYNTEWNVQTAFRQAFSMPFLHKCVS